jgi:preprotein translocase subunit SecA
MSEQMGEWIDEVVEMVVLSYTEAEYAEEWDLDGLVQAMRDLYGTDITVEELREEVDLTREALVVEFQEDARDEYAAKTEQHGLNPDTDQPLMRDLERFIVLQVVDTRWREHLENMEYLREGVHLRAMAQKDPLVEYTAEGHKMFEELGATIRQEVVLTLFHVELVAEDAEEQLAQPAASNGGNGSLSYEHQTLAGAEAIAAAGAAEPALAAATALGAAMTPAVKQQVASEHEKIGRNDPCWCGSGKKFKRCHGA